MIKSSNDYKIDKKLVKRAIRAFYTLLWKKNKPNISGRLTLDILRGSPLEKGFVTLRPGAICTTSNEGPLIAPYKNPNESYYTNDIDSVQTRRAQMAYFFTKIIGNLEENEIDTENFFNQ